MEPSLPQGGVLLLNRLVYWFREPKPGEIVIFKHQNKYLCKRILSQNKNNQTYMAVGDNADDSFDSRNFGSISRKQILGRVIL